MTWSHARVLVGIAGALALPLIAQEPVPVLIPVFASEPVPGVNGSSWTTDMFASNGGDAVATVTGIVWDCFLPECNLPAPLDPEVTIRTGPQAADGLHGALLYLEPASAASVHFGLRFRDLSRQASTWGTELPVPRADEFRQERFSLVDVPVTEGFRQTLRIYELDGTPRDASVRARLYQLDPDRHIPSGDPDTLLGEAVLPLTFTPFGTERPDHPGYAQITDLSTIAPLGDAESVRLEIEPVTEGLRLWAFVTVIHNETQQATVISPQ
jgi:hypothetical protein